MVKRLFFLLLIVLFGSQNLCAQTKYYKLTRKVTNGVSSSNVSGGQFISFTKDGCYESDKEGFSVNNGSLKYKYTEGGISVYVGNCYWGSGVFKFNSDKSRLNVVASNGDVYVYAVATPPSNQTTCSLIRKSSSSSSSSSSWGAGYSQPQYNTQPQYNNQQNNSGSSNENNRSKTVEKSKYGTYTVEKPCFKCKQTGTYDCPCQHSLTFSIQSDNFHRCPNCGELHRVASYHSCKCKDCGGKGYKVETKYGRL